jgi:citrate lyase subunit beta/citryl-CoA lyase
LSTTAAAGNIGPKVRDDCRVTFEARQSGAFDIQVESEAKRSLAAEIFGFFGIEHGRVLIEDSDAPDFVLAARIEACVKQVVEIDKQYLPAMIPENRYASQKKRLRLSRLYLPGNTPKMMLKAGSYGPHAVILDVEDAVAAAKKDEARLLVRNALRQVDFNGVERMVRINQLPLGLKDLEQLQPTTCTSILIPKCESRDDVLCVNETLDRLKENVPFANDTFLMPIIENSMGILNAADIAGAADNIIALTIGLEDYTADLGVKRTLEGTESFYARSHLVTVCKAYGIQAIDSVFSDVGNPEGLRQTIAASKALGFEGMGCIHPKQIPIIHEGYAPDDQEVEKAKRIVAAFIKAEKEGLGVVALGTKMIDAPVVERARQTINRREKLKMTIQKTGKD